MYIIQVTNFAGDVLFVEQTRRLKRQTKFYVKIRKFAKQYPSKEAAAEDIARFRPAVAATTFQIVKAEPCN